MAHTDRDGARWFWHDHFRWNKGNPKCSDWGGYRRNQCWCNHHLRESWKWGNPYRYEKGVPSDWHREQRKAERGQARNAMNRARAGQVDWDDLVIAYRRPYYW